MEIKRDSRQSQIHSSSSSRSSSLEASQTTTVETPVLGKSKAKRLTTTCKSSDGRTISTLVEEFHDNMLMSRQFEQVVGERLSRKEIFEKDGSLIVSETERINSEGQRTKITVRGCGKSASTRIVCGEVEARASERQVMIETPKASYSYFPFEGKWTSYYKEINMKLELTANFLKGLEETLQGPDGLRLVFRNGRLADLYVSAEPGENSNTSTSIPGIVE